VKDNNGVDILMIAAVGTERKAKHPFSRL